MEERCLLDGGAQATLAPAIVVGRTLSSYFVGGITGNQETITYTVYNEQAEDLTGVRLATTLQPGLTLVGASTPPDQHGQDLAWGLGTIPAFDRASVQVTVALPNPVPTELDGGAHASAVLDAAAVADDAPAAMLRAGSAPAGLLANTPDANTADPYVQEEAAALDYDPGAIFRFLQSEIGYESYVGSVRGARGTLWSGAGNALDVASLGVALMRASGIPAQYAQGTLTMAQAQGLIASMFPAPTQVVGSVPAGETPARPADDPTLLAETVQHNWFQFDAGAGLQDADPLIAGAAIGQAFTTATGQFAEVPDSLRAKTEIQLNAELYGTAAALFGLGSSPSPVFDQTFNDVDLVGRALTVGNFVQTSGAGGLIFSATTTTYTPYLEVTDQGNPDPAADEVLHGQAFQEILTNFPLGSQVLTGLFLDVTLRGPQAPTATFEKTLLDRIGFAARQGGGSITLPPISPSGPPALTENDLWTINALPGLQSPRVIGPLRATLSRLQAQLDAVKVTTDTIPSTGPQTDEQRAALAQSGSLTREIAMLGNAALGVAFARAADVATARLEEGYDTLSYYNTPRLVVASTHQDGANLSAAIDIMKNDARNLEGPGQAVGTSFFFEQMRGYIESALEGTVLAAATGQQAVTFDAVTEAMAIQGGRLVLITQDNLNDLQNLALPPDAKARITAAVISGLGVVTPSQTVMIGGQPTVEWLEMDFATGHIISVAPDGSHQAIIEYNAVLDNPLNVASVGFIGTMHGFAISQFKFIGLFLSGISANKDLEDVVREAKAELATDLAKDYISLLAGAIPVPETEDAWIDLGAEVAKSVLGLSVGPLLFNKPLDPLEVGKEVIKLILGKTLPGFSNLSLAYDAGLIAGSAYGIYYIATNLPGDPPLFPTLTTLRLAPSTSNVATGSATATAGLAASHFNSTVLTGSISVAGQLAASWSSTAVSGFQVSGLTASNATVLEASGKVVGSGAVAFSSTFTVAASVSGNDAFSVNGNGLLAFYGPNVGNLAVAGDWSSYTASVTGGASIVLTADGLTINGVALPAGTYTIQSGSLTLAGSGPSTSPDFTGAVAITATDATLSLGPRTGDLAAGPPLDPSNVVTATGYSGTINVGAAAGGNSVALNGSFSAVVQLTASPATVAADQNTPAIVPLHLATSLAGAYDLSANAPDGWGVAFDASGNLIVNPAPGVQSGTFPVRVVARSTTNPDLVAQTTVNVTVNPTQPGLDLTLAPDPTFTIPYQGALLPTAFVATLHNNGPAADTYTIAFPNPPAGFTIAASQLTLTLPAGATGRVGIYLTPNGPVPAVGMTLTLNVNATSTTTQTINQTRSLNFTMPAVAGLTITANPLALSTTPGTGATLTLAITNVGNVPESGVPISAVLPSGLTALGLHPVTLAVGQSTTETITLKPDASVPLNSTLSATIQATFGPSNALQMATVPIAVIVRSQQVVAADQASGAANAAGNNQLSAVLAEITDTLNALQGPSPDPRLFAQATAQLNDLSTLLAADPALMALATQLQPLQTAAGNQDATALLNLAPGFFNNLTGILAQEARELFQVSMTPGTVDLMPGQGQSFSYQVTNAGTDPLTLNLTVGALPSGVTATLGQSQVSLNPGQSQTIPVTLSQTIQSTRIFTLEVDAAASLVQHAATSVVAIRPAAADVLSVTVSPGTVNPGDPIAVSALIFNTANATRDLLAHVDILDATGNVLTSTPDTPVTLAPGAGPMALTLPSFDSTGLGVGVYQARVSLEAPDGSPIPGHPAQTPFLVGISVSASAGTDTPIVLPGTSTVTTTISVAGDNTVGSGTGSNGNAIELYYTRYGGNPSVQKVQVSYDGTSLTVGTPVTVTQNVPADGAIFLPDGRLVVANGPVSFINPLTGTFTSVNGFGAEHLALDPSGTKIWTSPQPGSLVEIPLDSPQNGVVHQLHGDDTVVTQLAFDEHGTAYYTTGSPNGIGNFGVIDLTTFTTKRYLSNLAGSHGIIFDPYTGDLFICDFNHITQIDPTTMTVVSDFVDPSGSSFDQGAVDGRGHVYVADNNGHLEFVDYSQTRLVGDPTNFHAAPFITSTFDDVAPLVGLGALGILTDVTDHLPASGYTVDPATINPTPSSTSGSAIEWFGNIPLTDTNAHQFQVDGTVADMAPGEVREISAGSTVIAQATVASGQQLTNTINLPSVLVAARHIISLDPPAQAADKGATATFNVTLTNPLTTGQTYTLSLEGLDGLTINLALSIDVPAGQSVSTPLSVTVPVSAREGTRGFLVIATTGAGGQDSVEGGLTVSNEVDTHPRGIVAKLNPTGATTGQGGSATYQVQLTNVGDLADTFGLAAIGLPAGVLATFANPTILVPSGLGNARDVGLTLKVPAGTSPGAYPFTIKATSTTDGSVTGTVAGTLNVTPLGVQVTLNPPSGAPWSGFQATVTNTGTTTDTFNLALGGPAALVATLNTNQVTLAPGGSQVIPIATNPANFAVPGPLSLVAMATSQTNPAIKGASQAQLSVPTTRGLDAHFSPTSRLLPKPGTATFLLMVANTGNTEDSYTATILGTNGPVTARLVGLDGRATSTIPLFRLPALASGAIELEADLAAIGQGTITVQIKSLSDGSEQTTLDAMVLANPIATMTQLSANPNPVPAGQPTTLTAVVTAADGSNPTGDVIFVIDGVRQAPVALQVVNGQEQATLAAPGLAVGDHAVIAFYAGNGTFAPNASNIVPLTVQPPAGPRATTIRLAAMPDVLSAGSPVVLTAVVASPSGSPTGDVVFVVDGVPQPAVAASPVNGSAQATLTVPGLAAGPHRAIAFFAGADGFQGSVSNIVDLAVAQTTNPRTTALQAIVSPNPVAPGTPVSLAAIVNGAGVTGGSVTFAIDGVALPPVPVEAIGGLVRAITTIVAPAAGPHVINANYSGDPGHDPSAAAPVTLTVNAPTNPTPTSVAPTVTSVLRFGIHAQPTTLEVRFSGPINPAQAQDKGHYHLSNALGRPIAINTATYDPATTSVVLAPSRRLDLHRLYRLTVDGGGPSGRPYSTWIGWGNLAFRPLAPRPRPTVAAPTARVASRADLHRVPSPPRLTSRFHFTRKPI